MRRRAAARQDAGAAVKSPGMFAPLTEAERNAAPGPEAASVPEHWEPIVPPPVDVPPTVHHGQLGEASERFPYHNADGDLEGYQCRFNFVGEDGEPDKTFRPRRYGTLNGKTGWHWKGWGAERPLYRLSVILANPDKPILVVEGEGKADAAQAMFPDFACTAPMNGAKSPHLTDYCACDGRQAFVMGDNDDAGRSFADAVAELATKAGAADVRVVRVPTTFPEKWDLADPPPEGWEPKRLRKLLDTAKPWEPDAAPEGRGDGADPKTEAVLAELAALSLLDYERRRKGAAKRLGMRVGMLDDEVARRRPVKAEDEGADGPSLFVDLEPWPEPVEGAGLLDALASAFTCYVVLPDGAAETMALWVMHAHAHDAAQISPILAINSPQPRCGKTTCLNIVQALTPRAVPTANITSAALFRSVEKWHPTILIDEADTFLRDNDELRGLLNAGHNRAAAYVIRTVGENHEPTGFRVWTPKVIALIGGLPDTLADRSIAVRLRRKRRDEKTERLRMDRLKGLTALARQAARCAADNLDTLRQADPDVPAELHDRAADNWRPLLAIADQAGGGWPEQARKVARLLSGGGEDDEGSAAVLLLADIRALFTAQRIDRINSAELVETLARMEERPWPEWRHGKPITVRQVARLLKPFEIVPHVIRTQEGTPRGYLFDDFIDAFTRYLPSRSATCNRGKRPGGQAAARWRMRSGKGRMGGAPGMSSRLPR